MRGSFIRNKNGRSHFISKLLVATGLGAEKYALCKTHLLIIDGKAKNVFVEVEPTVNIL